MRGGNYWGGKLGHMMRVEDLDTVCDNLKQLFDDQEKRNNLLQEQLKALKDEKWKDSTVQALQKQIDDYKNKYKYGFEVSEEEHQKILEWQKNHCIKRHNLTTAAERATWGGAVGGIFDYKFTPTTLGAVGSCICSVCYKQALRDSLKDDDKTPRGLAEEYDAIFYFQDLG